MGRENQRINWLAGKQMSDTGIGGKRRTADPSAWHAGIPQQSRNQRLDPIGQDLPQLYAAPRPGQIQARHNIRRQRGLGIGGALPGKNVPLIVAQPAREGGGAEVKSERILRI
jgi:hypothetical protein